ncbi:LysR family transcriptional regulator [Halocynthiibacter namhaensis]|uniref:LysR family transcriptional regulator n=1 Tax=Halocynthiibacter namhaensis TaxID=1290553 RepID=UPI0012E0AACD|nr:LysR family transcriptional regulator [Halocynthiibacter namhaensis]
MIPNTNDLLIFLSVTETRSITATADQCRVTKSAVSQALKRAEDAIGARLLFRTTRSMSLTETGMRLLPLCRKLRDAQNAVAEAAQNIATGQTERLCITAPHALCQALVVPVLTQLPELSQIEIRLIAEDAALNLVEHQIDLAIRVGAPAPQSARISKIGTLKESLWVSPDFLATIGGLPSVLQGIETWPHIASDWQGTPATYQLPSGETLTARPQIRCNTVLGLRDFIAQGAGIGPLPDLLAESDPKLTRVTSISESPIYAMHQHGKTPPTQLQTLVKALRKALR